MKLSDCVDISERKVLEWVRDNFHPEGVFTNCELRQWALANGFKEVDDED